MIEEQRDPAAMTVRLERLERSIRKWGAAATGALALIALCATFASTQQAGSGTSVSGKQSAAISIGPIELKLGQRQDDVLQRLGASFDVQALRGGSPGVSFWMVEMRGKPSDAVGSVEFRNNVLAGVTKEWDVDGPDTEYTLANAEFGAASSIQNDGNTLCVLHASSTQSPSLEVKSVRFTCGMRSIELDAFRNNGVGSGRVSEAVGFPN